MNKCYYYELTAFRMSWPTIALSTLTNTNLSSPSSIIKALENERR